VIKKDSTATLPQVFHELFCYKDIAANAALTSYLPVLTAIDAEISNIYFNGGVAA
jgi:hypothetical protein